MIFLEVREIDVGYTPDDKILEIVDVGWIKNNDMDMSDLPESKVERVYLDGTFIGEQSVITVHLCDSHQPILEHRIKHGYDDIPDMDITVHDVNQFNPCYWCERVYS